MQPLNHTSRYASTSISGWSAFLPPNVLTNTELEKRLDTTDEWIKERTGIRERRVGGKTSDMAVEAGRRAITLAGIEPSNIKMLVLATTTPDHIMPSTASIVHHRLGLSGASFDINAVCAGFVHAYIVANSMMSTMDIDTAIVIGSDCLSSLTGSDDRTTTILFGDGAGAVILNKVTKKTYSGILGADMGTDGSGYDLLFCPHQGTIEMEGQEIFRRAVRVTVASATRALELAGMKAGDISLFIPHQANYRIIQAVCERMGIAEDHTAVTIETTGNTSAASIPIALSVALDEGRVSTGDTILMSGFGAGMSWSSVVVRL